MEERHPHWYEADPDKCSICGKEFSLGDEPWQTDTVYGDVCWDCYYKYFAYCEECHRTYEREDMICIDDVDDLYVCKRCFKKAAEKAVKNLEEVNKDA